MLLRLLSNELLERVLRALLEDQHTLTASNLRDAWNVAMTCKKLHTLVSKVSSSMRPTALRMQQGVPHDVVTTVYMPDDVVQGMLSTLRSGGLSLRTVALSAMKHDQLRCALELLRDCPLLAELSFVDSKDGVLVPEEVASRLQTLTITSPQWCTLKSLYTEKCTPKKLQLLDFDEHDGRSEVLRQIWPVLTRDCISFDLTLVNCKKDGWRPQFLNGLRRNMCRRERSTDVRFGVRHTINIRTHGMEEGRYGASATVVTKWLNEYVLRDYSAPATRWCHRMPTAFAFPMHLQTPHVHRESNNCALVVLHSECEDSSDVGEESSDDDFEDGLLPSSEGMKWKCASWRVRASAHDFLHLEEGTLVSQFVDEKVGPDGIDTLLVTTTPGPLYSPSDAWVAALSAARLAEEAGNVRVLVVSAPVFAVLRHVPLPNCVSNVGVVDDYVTEEFVLTLPETLRTLSQRKSIWSVWVGDIPLRDEGSCIEWALKRAMLACRDAEAAGLFTAGVRGKLEQWLCERTG